MSISPLPAAHTVSRQRAESWRQGRVVPSGCWEGEEESGSRCGLDNAGPGNQGNRSVSPFHRLISKEKTGEKKTGVWPPTQGNRAWERQVGSPERVRATGLDPEVQTSFLTMSAFQEDKVVSSPSQGVCKHNTHLPAGLQRDSSCL